ncbi:hypothetical protein PR003_g26451 [Phytophthora rubi]|uniref:Uncharacterized protein n=3 Tax=Phytophthora TaxID=4783 RepID=A0A6A4C680_9STRA|nr:hypothetical protein PR003_g26450 [Phytophthora rubi]KAE9285933.1 hypothetical protein PR003_g26451 [Phytophthora rubi]
MSSNNAVAIEHLMHFMQAQQESIGTQMAEATRRMEQSMKTLLAKRRYLPTYQGKFNEDLDLWLFTTGE